MDHDEQIAHLRLIRTPNIGPMTFSLLMQRYGTATVALEAVPELARRGGRSLKPASRAAAVAEIAANEAEGATLLFKGGDGYPDALARFEDCPPVLSARGNPTLLTKPLVAIVGARNASINAMRLAQSLSEQLSANGYVVVSGLARGIDTSADNGALAGGTIAVIAGGIDIQYPPENADLQESIAEAGLLLAEMMPGTKPTPRHFPIRNRIIASLAAQLEHDGEAHADEGKAVGHHEAGPQQVSTTHYQIFLQLGFSAEFQQGNHFNEAGHDQHKRSCEPEPSCGIEDRQVAREEVNTDDDDEGGNRSAKDRC